MFGFRVGDVVHERNQTRMWRVNGLWSSRRCISVVAVKETSIPRDNPFVGAGRWHEYRELTAEQVRGWVLA